MGDILTVGDLKKIIQDLPDDTYVFTNYQQYVTGVYKTEYFVRPKHTSLYLIHTMSNCKT